jgi:hypothetical protein
VRGGDRFFVQRWPNFLVNRSCQQTRARGHGNLAQQTLEIVVSGCDSPEQAETAFRREIVKLIEVKTNGLVADASTR